MYKHRKLNLNIRKSIFATRVVDRWIKLPREAVECPPVDKTRLDMVLDSPL